MKKRHVIALGISFLVIAPATIFAQNWTLNGNGEDIYKNNSGNVGIGLQEPTGMLEISTILSGFVADDIYVEGEGTYNCVFGGPALILNGQTFDYLPNESFQCNTTSAASLNLMEVNLQVGSYNPPIYAGGATGNGFGGTFNYTTVRRVTINDYGQLGIGNNLDPTVDLDVEGSIRMRTGAQNGYVATSNAGGTMSWQPASSLSAFWQPLSTGSIHIKNKNNHEVHIGKKDHSLFLDPYLGTHHYRHLSIDGDVGMFFGPTESDEGVLKSDPGFVIGPLNSSDVYGGLRMDWDGNVCVGCDVGATGFKLSVNGNIMAELVQVKLKGGWPDYVFEDGYQLKPLSEVETYIKENGHLEGMPAASEVHKEGIDLGEMNRLLLEKLTLHIIELEKKIEAVK